MFVPQGWVGGAIGLSYALSYPSVGAGILMVIPDDLDTSIGCHGEGNNSENIEAAEISYNHIRNGWTAIYADPNESLWSRGQALYWLSNNNDLGDVYTHEFPNGTTGTFRVGPNCKWRKSANYY